MSVYDLDADVRFNAETAEFYRKEIEFPFFDYHLNGNGDGQLAKASVFETGTNQWRAFDAWPPPEAVLGKSGETGQEIRLSGTLSIPGKVKLPYQTQLKKQGWNKM